MGDAEEWLANYTQRVSDIQRQAEETQDQIKNMRAHASSTDKSVSVELAPGGRLEKLTLNQRAMDLGPDRLAAVITQTVQAAHADAAAQTQQALEPLVGESDAMEFLRDQIGTALEQEPGEQDATARSNRQADDDDDFGGSVLR